jgi:hypothetical protein
MDSGLLVALARLKQGVPPAHFGSSGRSLPRKPIAKAGPTPPQAAGSQRRARGTRTSEGLSRFILARLHRRCWRLSTLVAIGRDIVYLKIAPIIESVDGAVGSLASAHILVHCGARPVLIPLKHTEPPASGGKTSRSPASACARTTKPAESFFVGDKPDTRQLKPSVPIRSFA